MKKSFNKKIIFGVTVLTVSIAAWAVTQIYKPSSLAGVDKSTNITLVRKQKLMYPTESIGVIMFSQNDCLTSKIGYLKEVKKQGYVPSAEEVLTPAQIEPYFDVTIEEYFQGTDYARVESGRTILRAKDPFVAMPVEDPSAWNCAYKVVEYKDVQIRRLNKGIHVYTGRDGESGRVEVTHIPPENQEKRMPWTTKGLQKIEIDIPGSTYKCSLHVDTMGCYYRDMPVHLGTKQPIQLQWRVPPIGSKFEVKLDHERDKRFEPYPGTMRGGGLPKIEEFVSMKVGEAISEDKFEIPAFAKSFTLKETGKK